MDEGAHIPDAIEEVDLGLPDLVVVARLVAEVESSSSSSNSSGKCALNAAERLTKQFDRGPENSSAQSGCGRH
jgi:hypothetical protein